MTLYEKNNRIFQPKLMIKETLLKDIQSSKFSYFPITNLEKFMFDN